MATMVFGPRGIPATYRHMQGFGVNTYKWANSDGDTVLVKYHWIPKQGVKSLTAADAANIQAEDLGSHTRISTTRSSAATARSGSCGSR